KESMRISDLPAQAVQHGSSRFLEKVVDLALTQSLEYRLARELETCLVAQALQALQKCLLKGGIARRLGKQCGQVVSNCLVGSATRGPNIQTEFLQPHAAVTQARDLPYDIGA